MLPVCNIVDCEYSSKGGYFVRVSNSFSAAFSAGRRRVRAIDLLIRMLKELTLSVTVSTVHVKQRGYSQGPASRSGRISAGKNLSVHAEPHAGSTQNKSFESTDVSRRIRFDIFKIESRKYRLSYAEIE